MRIAMISTRFAGLDGVSLEAAKWAAILRRQGHEVVYLAGLRDEAARPGETVPEMHFRHPQVQAVQQAVFGRHHLEHDTAQALFALAERLYQALQAFLDRWAPEVVIVENALAIPMNVPLGIALHRVLDETGVRAIGHHHDFYWERRRFFPNGLEPLLAQTFPPALPRLKHVVINTLARLSLKERKGLDSVVVPNVEDFAHATPGLDRVAAGLRRDLGLGPDQWFILQPTRVVPRKGIEHALDLVAALNRHPRGLGGRHAVLVISHPAGDEGYEYLQSLQQRARAEHIPLLYAAGRFGPRRALGPEGRVYSLADAYTAADFVTYPSLYEGFGNAFLEAVYYRLPLLVNRYTVYDVDIRPKGFDTVEMQGRVTPEVVDAAREALLDPVRRRRMVEWNYARARAHFSFEAIAPLLQTLVEDWPERPGTRPAPRASTPPSDRSPSPAPDASRAAPRAAA